MVYKHQHFILDTETRNVYNAKGEEKNLGPQSFIMLEFLCKNKGVSELEDTLRAIDSSKEFSDDSARKIRERINSAFPINNNEKIVIYHQGKLLIGGPINEEKRSIEEIIKEIKESSPISKKNNLRRIFVFSSILFVIFLVSFTFYDKKLLVDKPKEEMILIPGGKFLIGSTELEIKKAEELCLQEEKNCSKWAQEEYPQHVVEIKTFLLDKKEVSAADFKKFVLATKRNNKIIEDNALPVVNINWQEASDYCTWVGKRLPTEEEWEAAARGGDSKVFVWGNDWQGLKLNHGKGNEEAIDGSDGYEEMAPVGTELGIGPYGNLNMAGNVSEWTASEYAAYPGNDKYSDPMFNKGNVVARGGSYFDGRANSRITMRIAVSSNSDYSDIGFRCARDAK